jgi:hypothetical protein
MGMQKDDQIVIPWQHAIQKQNTYDSSLHSQWLLDTGDVQ